MNRVRVLIIEDEMDLLDLIDYNLTRKGFVTAGVLDGMEVMEKIASFDPEVIILDLMLPGVDGWEICAELKKRRPETPVIMLTAKSMPEDKVRGLEAGAADYMTKPFSMKELIIRIDKLIEKKRGKEVQEIVFHEVTNRITTIGCYSSLLSRDFNAAEGGNAAHYLKTINHQVACAFESISELKALTNVESGEFSLRNERCDAVSLARQAVDSCKAAAELKSIKIRLHGAQIAPSINSDASAIKQVFINIIGNAVKYSAEKGAVEVVMASGAKGLSVSVRDEGRGIPEGDLPHIFENGFRGANAKGIPGSGIGLYVVKRLADALGAAIEVKSAPGRGSEFTIIFPSTRRIPAVTEL